MERRDIAGMLFASGALAAVGAIAPREAAAQTPGGVGLLGAPIVLTGSGTYTPSAVATAIRVVAVGGGGSAGGAAFSSVGSVTGGGGGGGVAAGYFTPVDP